MFDDDTLDDCFATETEIINNKNKIDRENMCFDWRMRYNEIETEEDSEYKSYLKIFYIRPYPNQNRSLYLHLQDQKQEFNIPEDLGEKISKSDTVKNRVSIDNIKVEYMFKYQVNILDKESEEFKNIKEQFHILKLEIIGNKNSSNKSYDIIHNARSFDIIHKGWNPMFKMVKLELYNTLKAILVDHEKITPNISNIFKPFIIDPKSVKVIIIGQDPYPTENHADGLAFSTNCTKTPASLKNIFSCLNRLNYSTKSNNLIDWIFNGVMLLNMALTTVIGNTKEHSNTWRPFINKIIQEITSSLSNLTILLWGQDAQAIEPYIKGKHKILNWTHPSPMDDTRLSLDKKFINCTNFDTLDNIDWSTGNIFDLYTDGAWCTNGNTASYAIYSQSKFKVSGLVINKGYILCNNRIVTTKENITPTSQRGEYLAMCYALWIIKVLNISNSRIITDSANTKGILTEWKKDTDKYINKDLVHIMRTLYNKKINIIHVQSHNKTDSKYNVGNNIVDKLAKYQLSKLDTQIDSCINIHI